MKGTIKMNIEDILQILAGVIIVISFGIAFFVYETHLLNLLLQLF